MSRPTTSQPEQHGVTHQGQAPQVAVRDGNRLLCPCCGQTLMVLKEKRFTPPKRHHAQGDPRRTWPSLERLIAEQEQYLNRTTDEVPKEEPPQPNDEQNGPAYRTDALVVPIDPRVAKYTFPEVDPPQIPKPVKLPEAGPPKANLRHKPPRDWNTRYEEHQRQRSKRPLEEATSYEMARLYAWAYYRLQRLAMQLEKEIAAKQAEADRLQAEPDRGTKEKASGTGPDRTVDTIKKHAQADLGVAPEKVRTRGMVACDGTQRHAHEDEGMAPVGDLVEPTSTSIANERGPP